MSRVGATPAPETASLLPAVRAGNLGAMLRVAQILAGEPHRLHIIIRTTGYPFHLSKAQPADLRAVLERYEMRLPQKVGLIVARLYQTCLRGEITPGQVLLLRPVYQEISDHVDGVSENRWRKIVLPQVMPLEKIPAPNPQEREDILSKMIEDFEGLLTPPVLIEPASLSSALETFLVCLSKYTLTPKIWKIVKLIERMQKQLPATVRVDNLVRVLSAAAKIYVEQGEFRFAANTFNQIARQTDGKEALAAWKLAQTYFVLAGAGCAAEALFAINRATELAERLGELEEAKELWQACAQHHPDNSAETAFCYLSAAKIAEALGQRAEAQRLYLLSAMIFRKVGQDRDADRSYIDAARNAAPDEALVILGLAQLPQAANRRLRNKRGTPPRRKPPHRSRHPFDHFPESTRLGLLALERARAVAKKHRGTEHNGS